MRLGNIILVFAIALGVAFLIGLGSWQMHRLNWKEGLIERVKTNLSAPGKTVEEIKTMIADGADIEYRPTAVGGTFLHHLEAHYFATHKGKPGYFIYTPLVQSSGQIIIVNRGYVPLEMKSAQDRQAGLTQGVVQIEGLARSAPAAKPNAFVPDNDLSKNIFYWKSLDQMISNSDGELNGDKVDRFFIDAGASDDPSTWPRGGVTRIEFPNNHLQYALTWFGLAGALLVVGGYFVVSRWRNTKHHS